MQRGVNKVMSQLHAAALEPQALPEALSALGRLVGVNGVSFEHIGFNGTAEILGFQGIPPAVFDEYVAYYHAVSPRLDYSRPIPVGRTMSDVEIERRMGTQRCNEFLAWLGKHTDNHHLIGLKVGQSRTGMRLVGFHHSTSGPANDANVHQVISNMTAMLADVDAAISEVARLRTIAQNGLNALDSLRTGIAQLDGFGRITDANRAFHSIIDSIPVLCIVQRDLSSPIPGMCARLAAATHGARTGRVTYVAVRDHGGRPVILTFTPVGAGSIEAASSAARIMVTARQAEVAAPDHAVLSEAFGLTQRETALCAALMTGQTLQEFADASAISVGTARVHLRNVFAKTGVSRQAELVATLASITAL